MRDTPETYHDTGDVKRLLKGVIVVFVSIFSLVLLWYVLKRIDFSNKDGIKDFFVGFSFFPLWVVIFLTVHKIKTKKKAEKETFEL